VTDGGSGTFGIARSKSSGMKRCVDNGGRPLHWRAAVSTESSIELASTQPASDSSGVPHVQRVGQCRAQTRIQGRLGANKPRISWLVAAKLFLPPRSSTAPRFEWT
jgi:hypothetical protein